MNLSGVGEFQDLKGKEGLTPGGPSWVLHEPSVVSYLTQGCGGAEHFCSTGFTVVGGADTAHSACRSRLQSLGSAPEMGPQNPCALPFGVLSDTSMLSGGVQG